jgi:hypothetical protein
MQQQRITKSHEVVAWLRKRNLANEPSRIRELGRTHILFLLPLPLGEGWGEGLSASAPYFFPVWDNLSLGLMKTFMFASISKSDLLAVEETCSYDCWALRSDPSLSPHPQPLSQRERGREQPTFRAKPRG